MSPNLFATHPSDKFFFCERCFYFPSQESHFCLSRVIFWNLVNLKLSDMSATSQYRSRLFISVFNACSLCNLLSAQCVISKAFFWGLNATVRQLKFKRIICFFFWLIYLVTAFRRKWKNQNVYCSDIKEYFWVISVGVI